MSKRLSEKDYWLLWNQLYDVVGPKRFDQALSTFGSAKKAWEAPAKSFEKLGWGPKVLEKLRNRENIVITSEMERSIKDNCSSITRIEPRYPESLRPLHDSPPVLYVRGNFKSEDRIALAVVGSRKMTRYGLEVVEALVPDLVSAGLTIVSGLALGVDTAAHKAALSSGGRTVAVLPCGIDQVYPASNQNLAREIVGSGALVTEFPPGTPPYKSNFPVRNRIISGLSLGTLVVEAAQGSGTFHTVSATLEQGKDVFAVPGSIFSPFSEGAARLIERGAKPVTRASGILESLETQLKSLK